MSVYPSPVCGLPQCGVTAPHHTHVDANGRSWCCGDYPYTTAPNHQSGAGQDQP